jgi:hypothetical protein
MAENACLDNASGCSQFDHLTICKAWANATAFFRNFAANLGLVCLNHMACQPALL